MKVTEVVISLIQLQPVVIVDSERLGRSIHNITMGGKDILILFGSQTGNSEDIAKDLHERCSKLAISSVCKNLNSVKKVDLKEIAKFIIVVCSTTGNGDTPENADAWWRSVKLRAAVSDTHTS